MKTILRQLLLWLVLSILMAIFWIGGLMISGAIFPGALNEVSSDSEGSELMLLIISMLNSLVLLYFINHSQLRGWKLVFTIFIISFGLQFFLSQIETLWFNDALKMSHQLIWTVVLGGAIMNLFFALSATWLTGGFKERSAPYLQVNANKKNLLKVVLALSSIAWPVIYLLAGYFIAWQFSEVRNYYTGSDEMESFYQIMKGNVLSGLYAFQIFRGLIWIAIGYLVLISIEGNTSQKAIILGLLFSIISSSQLLLPNPIMPEMVRFPHLLETSTSNFLWGVLLAISIDKYIQSSRLVRIKS